MWLYFWVTAVGNMDIKVRDIQSKFKQGVGILPACLIFYGDDAGEVRRLARQAAHVVVSDLNDPFSVDRLGFDKITQDPQILADLAGTMPLGAGKRLVLVDDGALEGANPIKAMQMALEVYLKNPSSSSVVVLALPYTEKKSALVRLAEKSPAAWAVRCYAAKQNFLKTDIETFFRSSEKKIDRQAIDFLKENLGNDQAITQQELAKLDIYTQDKSLITIEDCLNVVAAAPAITVYKLCDAIGHRDVTQCEILLEDILEDTEEYPLMLAMVYRHMKRLVECQSIAKEEAVDYREAVTRLRPPVANFAVEDFLKQVATIPSARLQGLVEMFYLLQLQLRTTSGVEKTLVHRLILYTAA